MRKKKREIPERMSARAAELFSLPESAFAGIPYLELHGDSSLDITGYESLVSYDSTEIRFCMKKRFCGVRMLYVEGEGLLVSSLRRGCLCVRGRIDALRFVRDEEGKA